jgi:glycerol uptake facilitator protein
MAAQREPSIIQRSLAEVLGTFLLVFIGAGTGTSLAAVFEKQGGTSGLLLVALAHGLALLIAIYSIGKISGAHVNPAVSIALASIGKLAWGDLIYYIISQLIGATLGALGILVVFGRDPALNAGLGATIFNTVMTHPIQAAAIEAFGAFILVLAIVGTAVDKRSPAGWAGLAIGFALAAAIMVLGPTTGASVNPARTFGPDIVLTFFGKNGHWDQFWVYVVGPIVGGVVAAWMYRFIARPDEVERAERQAPAKTDRQPTTASKAVAKKR